METLALTLAAIRSAATGRTVTIETGGGTA
jgi:hypothetical protein